MARYRVKRDNRTELYLVLDPGKNEVGRFQARIQAKEKAQQLNGTDRQIKSNMVFRQIADDTGRPVGWISKKYDGSPEHARSVAEEISKEMFAKYPDASNIESRIGSTDKQGLPKYTISPNFKHVAEVTTEEACYIWGDIKATPARPNLGYDEQVNKKEGQCEKIRI